ncbi:hypothetical protein Elgi_59110 [Paenibacillus elgii]|uniref:hypothetical protein n=1 Tax=Paenibacillus elgii TaxID=189691 RepID=UPI002D7CEC5E|nr:hypothetical protein Elgi_59110 [Paenibacillus elgii]
MKRKRLLENLQLDAKYLDVGNWPIVDVSKLEEEDKKLYEAREQAVILYMKGEISALQIQELTSIEVSELRRFIKRCCQIEAATGCIWGFRALIPNKRLGTYTRSKPTSVDPATGDDTLIKLNGAFTHLLDEYPEIEKQITKAFLARRKKIDLIHLVRGNDIHNHFLKLCKKANIGIHEYPFNTEDMGRRSLYRHLKRLEIIHFGKAAAKNSEEAGRRSQITSESESEKPIRPFQRVQFDGHRIDGMFTITYTTLEGDEVTVVLPRLWLLVIVDEPTRVIIGYHISTEKEYTKDDVLCCIKNSVVPHRNMEFTIPGLSYLETGGFPSSKIPEAEWALWDEISLDNGKSNLSNIVKDRLYQVVGCSFNPGAAGVPEARGIIERLFKTLEDRGYHRMINTTGSHPKDPLRKNPEESARHYQISINELEQITEVLISDYNGIRHGGINNFIPLELMQQRIERGMIPRILDEEKRKEAIFFSMQAKRTVRGSIKHGKRPFIHFEGVDYRSDVLSNCVHLIGKELSLLINVDDLRVIRAFLPDGSEFGYLKGAGRWGVVPHTLRERKAINSLTKEKKLQLSIYDDPMEKYHAYLKSKARTHKSAASKLAGLERNLAKLQPEMEEFPSISSRTSDHYSPKAIEEVQTNRTFRTHTY